MVKVSVIIPHFEDFTRLNDCLSALMLQSFPRNQFEIVVSDNASSGGEIALAKVIDNRAQFTICHERGAGPTRNAGAALATNEVLAFIDSDCVPTVDWIKAGVAALDVADVVGGHVSVSVRNPGRMSPTEAYETVFAFNIKHYLETKGFVGSGNLFVRALAFEVVGGFREAVSEDVDWSHRARSAGFSLVYSPAAEVSHPARETWAELKKKFFRVDREMFLLAQDKKHGRMKYLLRAWAMPASAFVHTFKIIKSEKLHTPRDRLTAVVVLFRLRFWRFIDCQRAMIGAK